MILAILHKLRDYYLRELRPRLAEDVHTEYYFDDGVWEKIKNFPRKHKVFWHILTPVNYGYIKNSLGTELDKDSLSKKMAERAKHMKENGYNLQLHIHFWQVSDMPTHMKRQMIEEALSWGRENGLSFKKLVPGWNKIDDDLPELCQKFGLEVRYTPKFTHDFELK